MSRTGTFTTARASGAALLLASCAGWWLDRPMFFAAWLAAWWFCLGLVLGPFALRRIHVLTGGRWGEVLAGPSRLLQRPLPWLLLLFLPMLAGIHVIYPWSTDPATWAASMAEPRFPQLWFAAPFFGARLAIYGVAWWWLARENAQPLRAGRAAAELIGWMLLTSLAAVDLLVSLVPGWASSVFGWLALVGHMTTGAAAAGGLAAWAGRDRRDPEEQPPVWRDLGNLMLMCVMLQAYLQFMQFLIIWAENLPREISWYLPRLQTGWWWVGLALIVLQFAVPLLALLWRRNKDDPHRLARIAAGIVAMQALGAAWLVVPSVRAADPAAWWLLPLVFAGMGLLLYGAAWPARRAQPLPEPLVELADGRS